MKGYGQPEDLVKSDIDYHTSIAFYLCEGKFSEQEKIWNAKEEQVLEWLYLKEVESLNERISFLESIQK